jgi:hypothetical protein
LFRSILCLKRQTSCMAARLAVSPATSLTVQLSAMAFCYCSCCLMSGHLRQTVISASTKTNAYASHAAELRCTHAGSYQAFLWDWCLFGPCCMHHTDTASGRHLHVNKDLLLELTCSYVADKHCAAAPECCCCRRHACA